MIREFTRKSFLPLLAGLSMLASSGSLSADAGYCCDEGDDCCFSFNIGAEFLYWDSYQRNHDFASKVDVDGEFTSRHHRPYDYNWRPGFRVGVSTENLLCDWDFYFGYTWIRHHNSRSLTAGEGDVIHSNLPNVYGPYDEAYGSRSVKTQLWDLLFSHRFEFCGCHFLTPYFGVQVVSIQQHLSGNFISFDSSPLSSSVIWGGKYTGAGLKIGLGYDYRWDECWDVYAKGSIALYAGNSNFHHRETLSNGEIEVSGDRHRGSQGNFVPSTHISVGTRYTWCVCDMPVVFNLAYEFLHFYNLPKFPRIFDNKLDSSDSNNLGYQGITIGASIHF